MIEQYYKGIGTINFHNRVHVKEMRLERNILTKDWARRFNLSTFGMICVKLFISTIIREVITSSLAVLQMSSLTTHREFS